MDMRLLVSSLSIILMGFVLEREEFVWGVGVVAIECVCACACVWNHNPIC